MKDWFEGKIVSIVGNAESLLHQNYAKEIDSADVVVRINRGGFRFPQYSAKMGGRIHVWCMQQVSQNRAAFTKPFLRDVKKMRMDTSDISPLYLNMVECVYSREMREELEKHLTKKSSTGMRVLHYVNSCNPKLAKVFGFDWKKSYSWHVRKKCTAHVFEEEEKYCKENFFSQSNFKLYS